MSRMPGPVVAVAATLLLAGCTLSRPDYQTPDVHVGESTFTRTLEAHTLSTPIGGNRAQLLVNGNEIFPAMRAAIRSAKSSITFANFVYEDGAIAHEIADELAERSRAGSR
jgi:phosphatidylserine/phosphatidylglycerophosphate/cardiolipin synthase-like enzyme